MTVLIIEDEAPLLRSLGRLFGASGIAVVGAGSVALARQLVASGTAFDVALCDWHLPDGDGYAVLRAWIEHGYPLDRFAFVTAEPGSASSLGARVFRKPAAFADLLAFVQQKGPKEQ